jgi:glycerol-3-phosphate acyltransferase PlsY
MQPDGGAMACSIAAVAAFLGHLFPVWLGFKGGKGVATFLGALLALAWPVGIVACMVWLIVARFGRISSLAALTAAATSPLYSVLVHREAPIPAAIAVMAVLVVIRHRANISRLMAGTEPKIGADKAKAA